MNKKKITYRKAGVDIDAASKWVANLKKRLPGIGSFSGAFPLQTKSNKKYLLVSGCDGVGTKLKLLQKYNMDDIAGIDLVAMNANDIITCGAKPLFFLDYIACGKLKEKTLQKVINGISTACRKTGMALLGGETAQMPGFYKPDEYDLAGFAVGLVERGHMITGKHVKEGDVVLGLPSSGPHSNGFSLIRKALGKKDIEKYRASLLKPTCLYVRKILDYLSSSAGKHIHGIAHITGGGFIENIPRILPENCRVIIKTNKWRQPSIFKLIQNRAGISKMEMHRTFNMGIGMVLIVSRKYEKQFPGAIPIGEVIYGKRRVTLE